MKKILIIEDDINLCETTADFLKSEGFIVRTAYDGADGLQQALTNVPDLILCDIAMPKIDGYEVFRALQGNSITSTVPFIYLTARVTQEEIRTGMMLGADDYITKPFELIDLLVTINTRISKKDKIIKASEESYHSFMENSPNGIFILQNSSVIYSNYKLSQILGFSKTELRNNGLSCFIHESDQNAVVEKINLCQKILQNAKVSFRGVHKEGTILFLSLYINNTKINGQTAILGYISTATASETIKKISKDPISKEIEKAIDLIADPQVEISKELAMQLINVLSKKYQNTTGVKNVFTKRENEIICLVCKGFSNEEIGLELGISERTAERHRTNIISKIGAKNIIEVIIYSIKNNLIEV